MAYRVLIVDDSPAMRMFVRRVVKMSGLDTAEILEAGDGLEALAVLDREWIDVVLTDINMPKMDGEELVKRMAASGLTQTVPVIVVSTDGTAARMEQLMALGARGYVVKPFTPEALREEMERAIGARDSADGGASPALMDERPGAGF